MPKFKPRKGQIDYTNIQWAPVINCVLEFNGKILIVQRSEKLNFYPGFWNGISGFLDDDKSFEEKVKEELREELGIGEDNIKEIRLGNIFHQSAPKYDKIWIVHPVLVSLKKDEIKLNWEAQNYKWTTFDEAKKFKLLPGFDMVLDEIEKISKLD